MTQTSCSVRPASVSDTEFIAAANAKMAQETEDLALDAAVLTAGVRAALEDPAKGRYFVAELDGAAAGCLLLTTEWSDWRNAWFWWIQSVYVDPAARRRGVFRALFDTAKTSATGAEDVCGLRLYVEQDNERAMRTYEGLGMSQTHYRMYELGC